MQSFLTKLLRALARLGIYPGGTYLQVKSNNDLPLRAESTDAACGLSLKDNGCEYRVKAHSTKWAVVDASTGNEVLVVTEGAPANSLSVDASGNTSLAGNADVASGKVYKVNGTQVVGAQQAHIADADGTLADITTKFNTLLSQLESHGLNASS